MADQPPGSPTDDLTYVEASSELERILAELDDDRVDVDVLAQRVRRAAELIRFCRGRITAARVEVERIVADLDQPDQAAPSGGTEAPAEG